MRQLAEMGKSEQVKQLQLTNEKQQLEIEEQYLDLALKIVNQASLNYQKGKNYYSLHLLEPVGFLMDSPLPNSFQQTDAD